MALMKKSALSFVMMVALVATCFIKLQARVEFVEVEDGESNSGGRKPCCDHCICTKSIPPKCQCTDIGLTCHPGCKLCICTFSEPPQCHCGDIKPYCYKKCTAPYASIVEAIATAV